MKALLALVVAGTVAALVVAGMVAALGAPPASALVSATSTEVGPVRVVLVGAPGLTWSDLERDGLPALRGLWEKGAVGSLTVRSVRTRSCAVDGWLTLSAGRRAADVPGRCRELQGVGAEGLVRGWSEYQRAAEEAPYDALLGALGEPIGRTGECVETVGPGAAIGGADVSGRVMNHHESLPSRLSCAVVLVDGGVLPGDRVRRADAVARLDALVADVRAAAPGADVLVAGVGDGVSDVRPRALVAAGLSFRSGLLGSASTRQPGVAQLQDLTATILARVGAGTGGLTGRPLVVEPSGTTAVQRVAQMVGIETRAATMRAVSPQVTGWLAAAYAVWAAAVAIRWRRRGVDAGVSRPLRVTGVALATVPVATFLANLVPWWWAPVPGPAFIALLAVGASGLTAAALRAERRTPLGALRFVAVVTLVVLAGDVVSGSRLQLGSVFGQNPVVGGRFYGLGNTSFALYGLAVLVVVAWVAGSRRWSRRAAGLLALGVLLAALALEALPGLGADFGGPPGLLLGGLLVIALAAGVRLTWRRVVAAIVGAGFMAWLVAWLDWLRPPDARTHLGEFVEAVVTGEAGAIVVRKLAQNVANLGSPPLLVMTMATLVLAVVAWRVGWRPVAPGAVVLSGAAVMAVVGFAVNDSGLVIPAFVAVVLAPLLVAAGPRPDVPAHANHS